MAYCEKHGEYEAKITEILGRTFASGCPLCIDEMERQTEDETNSEENAKQLRKYTESNIEPEYYHATFDTFIAKSPEAEHNLSRVKALVAGGIKKIVMVGKNGTGKTHLACAAIHELGGKIMTMYEISTTIRSSYVKDSMDDELKIVDRYARLPLFVIDEIGRTKGSDSEANWLSYIIDKRHVRGLPIILISNKHVRKDCDAGGCNECLENYIGEDIMSRLCEHGILLRFTGEDWRKSPKPWQS